MICVCWELKILDIVVDRRVNREVEVKRFEIVVLKASQCGDCSRFTCEHNRGAFVETLC